MNTKLDFKSRLSEAWAAILSNINVLALILIVLILYLINPSFLNTYNTKNLLSSLAIILVMASGATFVLLTGALDLSMGAVASVANVMFVHLLPDLGWWSYVVAIAFGAFSGLLLGTIHAKLKVPSFIASLGMMYVYESVALLISPSPISVPSDSRWLIEWGNISLGLIKPITIVALVLMVILYVMQTRTPFGKSLSLVGSNQRAGRLSGLRVDSVKIGAFTVCGITSAITGILLAVKLKSCEAAIGDSYTLLAIAAVVLGGTANTGGKGGIMKTLVGVLMVICIQNGMTIIGVDAFWSQIVFGLIVLVALVLTADRKTKNLIIK